jgi:site-specific DNA-cytosine methylase
VKTFSKSKRAQSPSDNETWVESETANTLNAFDVGDVRTTEAVVYAVDQGGGKSACDVREGVSPTLTTTHGGAPVVAMNLYGEDTVGTLLARDFKGVGRVDTFDRVVCQAVDCRNCTEDDINGALQSNSAHSLNRNNVIRTRYIVRRLTPLECERLQGYPDGWTDIGEWVDSKGKKRQTSDAARYKALGNSIALPPWKWVLKRLCACYERDATMASLFDGIGGFPYLWEQLNGKGTCLWASEIEEFPIAVTSKRIGGNT